MEQKNVERKIGVPSHHVRISSISSPTVLTFCGLLADSLGQEDILSGPYDPEFSFGSEAANLEYSILCAILGNPSSSESVTSLNSPTQASQASPVQPGYSSWPPDQVDYTSYPQINVQSEPSNPAPYLPYQYANPTSPQQQQSEEQLSFPQFQSPRPQAPLHPLQPRFPLDTRPRSPPPVTFDASLIGNAAFADIIRPQSCGSKLQSIHDRVTAPYDYTEGYHFLMKHLRGRCVCVFPFSILLLFYKASKKTISCASYAPLLSSDRLLSPCKCLFLLMMRCSWKNVSREHYWYAVSCLPLATINFGQSGAGQTYFVQRHTNCCMAAYWRNLSSCP